MNYIVINSYISTRLRVFIDEASFKERTELWSKDPDFEMIYYGVVTNAELDELILKYNFSNKCHFGHYIRYYVEKIEENAGHVF